MQNKHGFPKSVSPPLNNSLSNITSIDKIMKLLAAPCVNSFVFDARGITVEFIVVKASQDGSPVKSWQSFQVKGGELLLNPLKERINRDLLWSTGIR
ncbi:hypothetical protein OIU74_027767 [Salix koriyanagi]|uniref:Uncharacterized protein n=1 Tax=Salix koriyanagi TaxID=2511006 RepID=A0A9Q0VQR2_9ROSI|nr:hypothetical protein OIU74_027767 [Salix koriyanagi]